MEYIDAVFYINLESRPDRKDHLLHEVQKLCDSTKLHRIDAVWHKNGALGCTLSHIKTLETFLENTDWNTCIVLEDDYTFRSSDLQHNNHLLRTVFENFPEWDCCMLAAGRHGLLAKNTADDHIKKVVSAQTSSGYCVTRKFAPTLLANLRESRDSMITRGRCHDNCLDQHWKKIQPKSNWYLIYPTLGYQYGNYSDIEEGFTNYGC
jgi:glycosyl transferase family 25